MSLERGYAMRVVHGWPRTRHACMLRALQNSNAHMRELQCYVMQPPAGATFCHASVIVHTGKSRALLGFAAPWIWPRCKIKQGLSRSPQPKAPSQTRRSRMVYGAFDQRKENASTCRGSAKAGILSPSPFLA